MRKLTAAGAVRFLHDEQGRLVGEYDATGAAIREIVWFQNEPVALATATATYDIHADHLGTPRAITDAAHRIVWRWEGEPFGATLPDEDPDGDGTRLTFNLRFPGQYWDAETGLHHNWHRDYDPGTGRYVQGDPIGLSGGENVFGYVGGRPLTSRDQMGLWPEFSTELVLPESWCGSGRTEGLVPETWPIGMFKLSAACRNHDSCYAKCNSDKGSCDRDMKRDIERECDKRPPGALRSHCRAVAQRYYEMVDAFGEGPFRRAQAECSSCQ